MTPHTSTMDAYIRVSRRGLREGDSFQSPEIQREKIEAWAKALGVTILETHTDIDQTGKKFTRPGLDKALARIESGQTGGLATMNVKRFGRNLIDGLLTIKRIKEAGASFAAIENGLDISTDGGRIALALMLQMAEIELEHMTEQSKLAQTRAVRRGVHFKPPLGYVKKGKGEGIEPGSLAEGIRTLFRMRANGAGWAEIADYLNAHHPRDNGSQWVPSHLPKLIRLRTYLGEAHHGENVKTGAHAPLVTPEEFEAAQQPRVPGSGNKIEMLLRGIIRCAGCRYLMKADYGGRQTPVYRCAGRHGGGRCPAPAIVSRHIVDGYVEAEFLRRYGDIELAGHEATDAIEQATTRVAALERDLDAASDPRRLRALGHDRHLHLVEGIAAELEQAKAELQEARRSAFGVDVPEQAIWDTLSISEKRRVLAEGIDTVFLRRTGLASISDRALILWRGEAPDNLPGRGVPPVTPTPFNW
jgi:DNA invertase Pin-like site-specific DNA recombinase